MMSIMFFKGESLQPIVHLSRNVLPAKSALFVRLLTGLLSAFSNSLAIQKLKAQWALSKFQFKCTKRIFKSNPFHYEVVEMQELKDNGIIFNAIFIGTQNVCQVVGV